MDPRPGLGDPPRLLLIGRNVGWASVGWADRTTTRRTDGLFCPARSAADAGTAADRPARPAPAAPSFFLLAVDGIPAWLTAYTIVSSVVNVILYIVIIVLLMLPASNAYFKPPQQGQFY